MGHFKTLRVYQQARSLAVISKGLIERLPAAERYALADQWRRASYSVVLNLAERASRRGTREFRRHVDIARAELDELEAIADLVCTLGYFSHEDLDTFLTVRAQCARGVFALGRSLDRKSSPE